MIIDPNLIAFLVVLNLVQFFVIMRLIGKLSKHRDAVNKIDDIVSDLKKDPYPQPDPRQKIKLKIWE